MRAGVPSVGETEAQDTIKRGESHEKWTDGLPMDNLGSCGSASMAIHWCCGRTACLEGKVSWLEAWGTNHLIYNLLEQVRSLILHIMFLFNALPWQ